MNKRVIIYVRVSTDEQMEKGHSVPAQIEKLRTFCKIKNWEIIEVYEEDYTAWKGFNRPSYNKLADFLTKHSEQVDFILFTQWSRFSRDATASLNEIAKLRSYDIEANAIEQWIDFKVPEAKYLLALYLIAPQVENERLSLRVKAAIIQGRREGRSMGKAPFGYKNDKITKLVFEAPEDAKIVRMCFALFAEGIYKAEEVRRMGKELGLKLHKQAFLNMLKNPFYIGKVKVPATDNELEFLVPGLHEAIITAEQFDTVQSILAGKKKPYKGNTRHEELPLIGHLICPKCNKIMTGSGSKGNGGIYHYYHCQRKYGCKNNIKAKLANNGFEKYLKTFEPKPEVLELYQSIFETKFISEVANIDQQKKELEVKIKSIEAKIELIEDKYLNEILSDSEYRKFRDRLEEEKSNHIMKHATLKQMPSEFALYLKYGLSLVGNISNFYKEANPNIKTKIISSIFPENLIFENNDYRTTKTNAFFALLSNGGKDLGKKKADISIGLSIFAPPSGLEPETL